ncbi:MAG: hypothetical protein H0W06_01730 [Chloroflexia bacterium]|nr:hypothetical protein [Chloroflexia bacterium]
MSAVWFPAHVTGASGWHAGDLLSALLVVVVVAGLTLLAAGRRARLHAREETDGGR